MAEFDFYTKEIKNIQKKLFKKLSTLIFGLSQVSDVELIQLAKQIDFFNEMERLGYTRLLNSTMQRYTDQISLVYGAMTRRELGQISAIGISTLQDLAKFEMDYLKGSVKQYADTLKNAMMRRLVTGEKTKDILLNLERGFGVGTYISSSEANFLINDGFARFTETVKARAYKDFPKIKFEYIGPNDNRTRTICLRALTEGQLTQAEIRDKGYDMIDRGGWNCRHRWARVF